MATSAAPRRWVVRAVLLSVAMISGVTAAVIGALALPDVLAVTGLSDPGPFTTYGLSFVRAAGEIAAMVAIGHFLFAAFLVPPQASGVLDVDGYRALRVGGVACATWAVCAALLVALTVSDVSGVPLTELTPLDVWSAADLVETSAAWRTTSILAAVVAVTSVTVLRWSWTPALLVAGLVPLMPLAVPGYPLTGNFCDIAANSLIIHLVAGTLWAGGLLALLGHALRGGGHTDIAARRFSGLALWCFASMAVSGIVNAAVRINVSTILNSSYGLLILGKLTALLGLGVIGWRQRRSSIVALQRDPTARRPLLRLALTEAALFGVAVGVAVGLGRTPPPPATREPLPAEAALGFDLAEPPTIARVFVEWRFDLIFGTAAVVIAGIYLVAVYRLSRRGAPWSTRRTVSWLIGCLALLFTTSSGLGMYMAATFSVHAVAQLVLTIVVPVLLVQGAPVTLALKALQGDPNGVPGAREWLVSALNSSLVRSIAHPWTALALLVVGVYGLCLEAVFDAAVSEHGSPMLMIGYFLVSGSLFFAAVSGVEPVPRLMPKRRRIAILLFGLSQFVIAGVVVMNMREVLGDVFYRSLKLSWHADLLGDQQLGGQIIAAGGLLAVGAALAVLILQRRRSTAIEQRAAAPSPGS